MIKTESIVTNHNTEVGGLTYFPSRASSMSGSTAPGFLQNVL